MRVSFSIGGLLRFRRATPAVSTREEMLKRLSLPIPYRARGVTMRREFVMLTITGTGSATGRA